MSSNDQHSYDAFSDDYDRFVNWQNRLNFELPFLLENLAKLPFPASRTRILDAACGTGMHALALAQRGFQATGSDLSAGMIERAQVNAQRAQLPVRFEVAGFGDLAGRFGESSFDALLCLGNSLPHLPTPEARRTGLRDFARCLEPGGLFILQNRNFDAVMASRERAMEPAAHSEDGKEWVFLRFYNYLPDGLIEFNIVTLFRANDKPWKQAITHTTLLPLLQGDLLADLEETGFTNIQCFGGLNGSPFEPRASGNLVVTARKRSS